MDAGEFYTKQSVTDCKVYKKTKQSKFAGGRSQN